MACVVLEAGVIFEALGEATAGKGNPQILRESLPSPGSATLEPGSVWPV
jgi:hypothetical protein